MGDVRSAFQFLCKENQTNSVQLGLILSNSPTKSKEAGTIL